MMPDERQPGASNGAPDPNPFPKDDLPSATPTHYVGIGASAGGLEALESFFTHTPPDCGLAFIVVQHLSPDYKSLMVELLSKRTAMKVLRAEEGMQVEANHVYLIPPKQNLTISRGRLLLKEQEGERGINLPIDIFFRSLAEDQGERAIAIVLSGTGSDGTRGVRAVKEVGGMVMVQDQHSAKFDGMPRAAVSTGLADFVLPPEEMPRQLLAYTRHPFVADDKDSTPLTKDQTGMARIFTLIRNRTKVDFSQYKASTIVRRIERRMSVNQIHDLRDYVDFLESYPGEVLTLYRELLIGVTSFFRDPEAFDLLAQEHIPEILARASNREIRFWCAGCSTGEEAYSLAILLQEGMEKTGRRHDVKIFATDIDRDAVLSAGEGRYPESIAADIQPRILSKYFYPRGEHYQIARNVREMVVFAQHNLLTAPPFTNIDLVSCRNLLIYLQPSLQQQVMRMFNFSLNSGGILLLGSSESVGEMSEFFEMLHSRHKIFRSRGRKTVPIDQSGTTTVRGLPRIHRQHRFPLSETARSEMEEERLLSRYLEVLSNHYVPLSVVVNERMEVVHKLGDSEGFFTLPSGRTINDISRMAAKELAIPLATGIQKAFRTGEELVYSNIQVGARGEAPPVRMRIVPMPEKRGQDALVAVFLEPVVEERKQDSIPAQSVTLDLNQEAEDRIADLEHELQFTKENLQATIEELETANEELQATNEELLASNEELQATNEELQATNEELHTVNAEYQNKIIELRELNNDVDNLLAASGIGKLLLDENLEIRRFSPTVTRVFRILEADVGRPISHITHTLQGFCPQEEAETVQRTHEPVEREVQAEDGHWYLVRIMPYLVGPEAFSGVVFTFVDITELKHSQEALATSLRRSADIIRHMPAGLFIYRQDEEGKLLLESGNPEAERSTGLDMDSFAGRSFEEIWPNAADQGLISALKEVMETGEPYYAEEFRYQDDKVQGSYRISAFPLPDSRLAVSFEDSSRLMEAREVLQATERSYRTLFETMTSGVVFQGRDGEITSANPAAEEILGLSRDQLLGRTSVDPRWRALDEDGAELPGEQHPSMVALRTGKAVRGHRMGVFNPREERIRWIQVNAVPLTASGEDTPSEVYTTFDDVTSRVEAELGLRRARERLEVAYHHAGLAWWDWHLPSGEVDVSPRKAELLGFSPREVGRDLEFWTSRIHPDDHDETMAAMREHLAERVDRYQARYRLRRRDGTFVLLEDRGEVYERGENGEPVRVLGTVREVED